LTSGALNAIAALITAVVGALTFYYAVYLPYLDHQSGPESPETSQLNLNPNLATLAGKTIMGNDERNSLTGTEGADNIQGFGKDDVLLGLAGNDVLDGGHGEDTLDGGAGDDTLNGGDGDDSMTGGTGKDQFNCGDGNSDRVLDYSEGEADTKAADCEA
jgi:Ca2+-binding RTX toxin-like protein